MYKSEVTEQVNSLKYLGVEFSFDESNQAAKSGPRLI
jgi:hypothetical protein